MCLFCFDSFKMSGEEMLLHNPKFECSHFGCAFAAKCRQKVHVFSLCARMPPKHMYAQESARKVHDRVHVFHTSHTLVCPSFVSSLSLFQPA